MRFRTGPKTSTMSARQIRPAAAPRAAGRAPRTAMTASTMVIASTASTSEAVKAAAIAGVAAAHAVIARSVECRAPCPISALVFDGIPQHADALDVDLADIARLHPERRFAGMPDARRRARYNHVARLQRHAPAYI